jgi:hypothetical protein
MNYIPIHTNISPNYNYLSAENAYLKHNIEYKDAVICEQQAKITELQKDVQQLSNACNLFKQERDKHSADAERWRVMKKIILTQGGQRELYEVQKTIDKDIENAKNS